MDHRNGKVYVLGRHPICTVEGCGKPHCARGMCGMHYQRWSLHGDVHRKVRRANGEGTLDALGYIRVMVPHGTPNAYEFFDKSDGRDRWRAWMLEHRFVMQQHLGRPLLPGESVHHKNGVRKRLSRGRCVGIHLQTDIGVAKDGQPVALRGFCRAQSRRVLAYGNPGESPDGALAGVRDRCSSEGLGALGQA